MLRLRMRRPRRPRRDTMTPDANTDAASSAFSTVLPPSIALVLPVCLSQWGMSSGDGLPVPCPFMTQPAQDNDLDPYEAWTCDRLTPLLGPLRKTDRRGGPSGLHDFEVDLPDGSIAALEVTGEVDRKRLDLAASAERHLSSIRLPGSIYLWLVGLAARARVNAIKPKELERLLRELEASGRRKAQNIGHPHDPFVAQLGGLGIESIFGVKPKPGSEGKVLVRPGSYGGWGWDGPTIDEWLGKFFASHQAANKLRKLGRATATERHLVIVLDSFSPAGIGVPLGLQTRREPGAADYRMPSFRPPDPLTHCWLLPAFAGTEESLRWTCDGRWAVLDALQRPPAL